MSKTVSRTLYLVISLAALTLSACGASISNAATQTQAVVAIYTAAAQTIEANAANFTATTKPSETITTTPTVTPTITPTSPETLTPTKSAVQNYCDNALFVSDVSIPDNTVMNPGQAFDKTWAFQNTGTCAWSESYSIVYVSGDMMNGAARTINQVVVAQQQANITVKLTAPVTPGTYTGYWRLANSKGELFGNIVSVVIKVGAAGTATITLTPGAATATSTAPAAATATASETPAPSVTPTVTATVP